MHGVPDWHGVHLDQNHLQAFAGTYSSMRGTRQPASRDRFAPKLGIDVIDGVLDDTSETVVVLGAQPHGGVRTPQNRPERKDPGVLLLALFLGIHGQSQFLEVNHFAGMPSSDHTGH